MSSVQLLDKTRKIGKLASIITIRLRLFLMTFVIVMTDILASNVLVIQ